MSRRRRILRDIPETECVYVCVCVRVCVAVCRSVGRSVFYFDVVYIVFFDLI